MNPFTGLIFVILPLTPLLIGNASDINPDADVDILAPSPPYLSRITSSPLREVEAGEQLVVTTNVKNNDAIYDWPAYVILEVRDSNGITISLSWQSGIVQAGNAMEVGVSWIPEHAGTYELRTFAVSSLDSPRVLSTVSVSEVTIEPSSGNIPLLIGNNTYDIRYEFPSGNADIVKIEGDPEIASVFITIDDVVKNTVFQFHIPLELFEEFRNATNDRFIEDELYVFVDEISIYADWEKSDDEWIGTIELDAGSRKIEIVGGLLI